MIYQNRNTMKFLEHPKVGQEVKGYIVEKYISKIIKQTGSKLFYLCLQIRCANRVKERLI